MLKSFWFWTAIVFIAMQFFSLDIPAKLPIKQSEELQAPNKVMSVLKRSCFDCHSSEVKAPWYYKVAPISWFTQVHVKNARAVVNFSKWNSYSKEKQYKVLDRLPKSLLVRMPMPSYLYMHKDATLSKEDKKLLNNWAKELKEKIK